MIYEMEMVSDFIRNYHLLGETSIKEVVFFLN